MSQENTVRVFEFQGATAGPWVDVLWTKTGPTAAICDDVTNRPINLICAAAVLGVAAMADRLSGRDA